ncbi:MAG: M15 family metallopeptidase [Pseudomonadota bacterium]
MSPPHVPPDVIRRADGTIRPLRPARLAALYGPMPVRPLANGRVLHTDDWPQRALVEVKLAGLARLGVHRVRLNRCAAPYFQAAFEAISAAGLSDRILSFHGAYVPRKKGWNPKRTLSAHAYGVAIDLNAQWNGYGARPAGPAEEGGLTELVPIFARYGFAWGGHFKPAKYADGMHFELARLNL